MNAPFQRPTESKETKDTDSEPPWQKWLRIRDVCNVGKYVSVNFGPQQTSVLVRAHFTFAGIVLLAAVLCREHRYSHDQILYHYTSNRAILRQCVAELKVADTDSGQAGSAVTRSLS